MNDIVYGVKTSSVSTDIIHFVSSSSYKILPAILLSKNGCETESIYVKKPIQIFYSGVKYNDLYTNIDMHDRASMALPWKAFNFMKSVMNRNVNKISADIVAAAIIKELKKNEKGDYIFFINCEDPQKIIGRLGYLYIDLTRCTIVFLTYEPQQLVTDVLNAGREKLEFDINYFKNEKHQGKPISDVIPNDFRESLTQTVFFNITPPNSSKHLSPLRCDIFCQGMSNHDINNKVKKLEEFFSNDTNLCPPFVVGNYLGNDIYTRLPYALKKVCDYEPFFVKSEASVIMEKNNV